MCITETWESYVYLVCIYYVYFLLVWPRIAITVSYDADLYDSVFGLLRNNTLTQKILGDLTALLRTAFMKQLWNWNGCKKKKKKRLSRFYWYEELCTKLFQFNKLHFWICLSWVFMLLMSLYFHPPYAHKTSCINIHPLQHFHSL